MVAPDPKCARCGGSGFVEIDGLECVCRCMEAGGARACTDEEARIPPKFRRRSFENFRIQQRGQGESREQVMQFVEGFLASRPRPGAADEAAAGVGAEAGNGLPPGEKNGLLLWGEVGRGKTHLAVAAMREMMTRGFQCRYWNVKELFRSIRATFQGDGDEALLEELTTCDVLLLDDLGTHRNTDFVIDRLYLIINQRYDRLLPLIVTTNLDKDRLMTEFDETISSRLFEMCQFIQIKGPDFRMTEVEASGRPRGRA